MLSPRPKAPVGNLLHKQAFGPQLTHLLNQALQVILMHVQVRDTPCQGIVYIVPTRVRVSAVKLFEFFLSENVSYFVLHCSLQPSTPVGSGSLML